MERVAEYGVCRLIQSWITTTLRESGHSLEAGIQWESQDEGDYETKLTQALNRRRGLFGMISILGLTRGPNGFWEVGVAVSIQEDVKQNRSGIATPWTAARVAEMVLATFQDLQMESAPYASLTADDSAIELESETPALVYRVRLRARLGANLVL